MNDSNKTKEQLIQELEDLRRRNAKLEKSETERKLVKEALQESEERYRTAIEQSNDGVVLVKEDRLFFVNQKMVEIFGYDRPEEIIGLPIEMLIHPGDQERVKDLTRRRQQGEAVPQKYEFKGCRKNGELIYIEVSATKITFQGEALSLAYLGKVSESEAIRWMDIIHGK